MWYERSHVKATLTCRCTPLATLWYSRARKNLRKPDLVFRTNFISWALSDVSSDVLIQGEENSLGNLIIDDFAVTFCDHGSDFGY